MSRKGSICICQTRYVRCGSSDGTSQTCHLYVPVLWKKAIILLDEYDTPLQEAYVYGYWEELTTFIRSLFNCTFKTNPYLERGLMTGITRVSKESIFRI